MCKYLYLKSNNVTFIIKRNIIIEHFVFVRLIIRYLIFQTNYCFKIKTMNSKDDAQRQTESWLLLSYKFLSFKWKLQQIISEKKNLNYGI